MINTENTRAIINTIIDLGPKEEVILNNYLKEIDAKSGEIYHYNERQTAATLYYMVQRKNKTPVSLDEVGTMFFGSFRRDTGIQKYYKYLIRKLDIKNDDRSLQVKPSHVLPHVINNLELTDKEKRKVLSASIKYGKQTWKHYIGTGANVYTYCSGLVYIAGIITGCKITQTESAIACDVTTVGTRKYAKTITLFLKNECEDFSKIESKLKKYSEKHGPR